ncbi:RelA/SpoT family protein [Eubacterium ventriosum]|jgi:guanosine-3',5'-bis(diphosphate) 3'-pyrophosphohydrolase|uniref:RelA/SpoT family protein n=1 Tax=Eubacterium ventriosum TaxID=39496 RepID=UPI002E77B647|nr:bifunctional (p)ppGpp synthetase/guanosine-3',5'-bis(diphosphate) 3'-pyrophosphohydrolase [Eubacterium ventriosum]MEE0854370.1 bifunctional (p)ppGpp synthetase/guanosine-3',5'-bis(diphosphate) 3'-pyrophosphohydrolase [Eubacterium ventriosum]
MGEKNNINVKIENHGVIPKEEEHATPEELYSRLIDKIKRYHPSAGDLSAIDKAYNFAKKSHGDQKRKSGEPYIIHPIHTALILADLELDKESIMAGLLHDVMEDTKVTREQMISKFGEEVTDLVDGVTKLTKLDYDADKVEKQAENLRKMFLAMAKDIRVILIKLADRLHNMRTLQYMTPEKQKEKSKETMEIYAPIADRLGISKIKIELDDLALRYLEPEKYKDLVDGVHLRLEHREEFMSQLIAEVAGYIEKAGIKATIDGRVKHYFSIYKKMVNQHKTLDQIYDVFAIRIIVDTVMECYGALGVIHEKYTPVPGRFKDYIAMPKQNMYQSLHTTLIGPNGQPFEIQIRTMEMHKTAEYGIAAHWKYKENITGEGDNEEQKISWLRQILEWQRDLSDNHEFLNLLKDDLNMFSENVYCFTPNGDLKSLPNGSTPIDFAYSIHSAVGNKMVGARVNGKMVNIDYKIQNGDQVEVVTSNNSNGPSMDWLKIVKSTQAKNKINQWFKLQNKEENIIKGKELIDKYCKSKGIVLQDILKPEYMEKVRLKYSYKDWNSLVASVGHGGLKEGQIVNKLVEEYNKTHRKEITDQDVLNSTIGEKAENKTHTSKSGIIVEGMDDVAVRFSKCCSPVPGDEIIGFVTRGRGVSIHRTDCINIINLPDFERGRLIEASWAADEGKQDGKYMTEIVIYAHNRVGILTDLSKIFTEKNIDVNSINSRTSKSEIATISMSFAIQGTEELNSLISRIRQIDSIIDIERTTG